jgi:hypothetical protein
MAGDGQFQIVRPHAVAIIGNANGGLAAGLQRDGDVARASIQRVLHQFLHHACRALDHLASGDAVDHAIGQLANAAVPFNGRMGKNSLHMPSLGDPFDAESAQRLSDDDKRKRRLQDAVGDAADVVHRNGAYQVGAFNHVAGRNASSCMPTSCCAIFLRAVEAQRIGADQKVLGLLKLLLSRAVLNKLGNDRAHAHPAFPARVRAGSMRRRQEWANDRALTQIGVDRVGQTAFLAHLLEHA